MRIVVLRRVLLVAALGAVLAHGVSACSNEQDLNPQPLPPGSSSGGDNGDRKTADQEPSGGGADQTSGSFGSSASGSSSGETYPATPSTSSSSSSGSLDAGSDADSGDR